MGAVMRGAIDGIIGFLAVISGYFASVFDKIIELPQSEAMSTVDTLATAVGISLATAFLAMEIFSMASEFKTERIEDAIRIGMKFVVFKIIIENTGGLCAGIYDLLSGLGTLSISENLTNLITSIHTQLKTSAESLDPDTIWAGIFQMPSVLDTIGYIGVVIVTIGIMISIALTLIGVVFEVSIHRAVAPIALSTLVNSTTRQTGVSFIKSYSACCLQFFVMSTMVGVGAAILDEIQNVFMPPVGKFLFSGIIGAIGPIFGLMVISNGLKKSGDITKRLLGA